MRAGTAEISRASGARKMKGFTLIELMITVAILAILATLAVPSFTAYRAKKQLEGIASELITDLQYARSEAVQRNEAVAVFIGTNCYAIHLASATAASCTSTTPAAAMLKPVALPTSLITSLAAQGGLTTITFDPIRTSASFNTGDAEGAVLLTSSVGSMSLRASINATGRPALCMLAGSNLSGYSTC